MGRTGGTKYKVLVIDDSAVVRKSLTDIIAESEDFMVIGTANDPYEARKILRSVKPDVVTLDIEMPRMNGLTFLDKLMKAIPVPVVMISSSTQHNAMETLKALELGAVDYIPKPNGDSSFRSMLMKDEVLNKLRSAVRVPDYYLERRKRRSENEKRTSALSVDERFIIENSRAFTRTPPLIVLGASTGGTVAIEQFLGHLNHRIMPPIAVVQHIPPVFSSSFARRLDDALPFHVFEAQPGLELNIGDVAIAPGNRHIVVEQTEDGFTVNVREGMKVNRHIPSVDVLFRSAAREAGGNAIGVLLTGMGRDGARGLLEMKERDSICIGQALHECAVESMPRSAHEMGAVDHLLSLKGAAMLLNTMFGKK